MKALGKFRLQSLIITPSLAHMRSIALAESRGRTGLQVINVS